MDHLIRKVRKGFDEKIHEEEQALGSGKAVDWSDYKRRTGIIQGLRSAKDVFNDTIKQYFNNDEVFDD